MNGAADQGHLEVLNWLLRNRSERCTDHTVWRVAARGHLHIMKFLLANFERFFTTTTIAPMGEAISYGRLEIIKWLHKNRTEGCTTDAMDLAAKNGHLHVLRFLYSYYRHEGCTPRAMDSAAQSGHLDIVQWIHEHRAGGCTTAAMDAAARLGHVEMLHFLASHRTEGCMR